ncbi:hypothetical protein K438DRAFT_1987607 [Mycena galopus ATCC 62051]|nr:hypothetical protein K438DRAFT_1987607 [Mycena galopus ATCC 62051]
MVFFRPESAINADSPTEVKAWEYLRLYAVDEMTPPAAEAALQEILGDEFSATSIWRRVLSQTMGCETAEEALQVLADVRAQLESPMPAASPTLSDAPPQLTSAEKELMDAVCDLQQLTLEFQNDADIVAAVCHEEAVEKGEVIEIDDDSEDEDDVPDMATVDILQLCQQLEKICLAKGQVDQSMVLAKELRQFRAHVQRDELLNSKQLTPAEAWGMKQ